jgi:hypothetical protein
VSPAIPLGFNPARAVNCRGGPRPFSARGGNRRTVARRRRDGLDLVSGVPLRGTGELILGRCLGWLSAVWLLPVQSGASLVS